MKPVDQTMIASPEGGQGNCLEACIASLFEIDVDQVDPMRSGNGKWWDEMCTFLNKYGYDCEGCRHRPDGDSEALLEISKQYEGVNGYVIMCGDSPRGDWVKGGHSVIYKDGVMVHDPHPSKSGLANEKYFLLIQKVRDEVAQTPSLPEPFPGINNLQS